MDCRQRLRRKNVFTPRLEDLEERSTPAVNVTLNAGVLAITGDANVNIVSIAQNDAVNNIRVRVSYPSGPYAYAVDYNFASTDVQKINANLKGGADHLSYGVAPGGAFSIAKETDFKLGAGRDSVDLQFLQGVAVLGGSLKINVQGEGDADTLTAEFAHKHGGKLELSADMGDGNDIANVRMAGDITGGADVEFSLLGGVGNDNLYVDSSMDADYSGIDVVYNATFATYIDGGANDDWITAMFNGKVTGNLSIYSRGGDNNDTINAYVDLLNANNGVVSFNTFGDGGKDTLDHRLRNARSVGILSGYLNGGSGYDLAKVTYNVFTYGVEGVLVVL